MDRPKRKNIRLKDYNYNMPGYYFITICTKDRRKLLCDIVGTDLLGGPKVNLTPCGEAAEKQLRVMADFYDGIRLEKYVIMPNHVHMLIQIWDCENKPSERSTPTDTKISKFVGTFKRFCNKSCGYSIWQERSYDHVVRGEKDYTEIWKYIDNNPACWTEDCFYEEPCRP